MVIEEEGPRNLFKKTYQQLVFGRLPQVMPPNMKDQRRFNAPRRNTQFRPSTKHQKYLRFGPEDGLRLFQTKLLLHHFQELSWALLPDDRFKRNWRLCQGSGLHISSEWISSLLIHVGPRLWHMRFGHEEMASRPAVPNQVVDISFWGAFLGPSLLPDNHVQNILVLIGLDAICLRDTLNLHWSFMFGFGCDHMRFGHESGVPSGCSKPSCWFLIFSFPSSSSGLPLLKQF